MDDTQIKSALECLLFVSGDPVPLEQLADALEEDPERVAPVLEDLRAREDGGRRAGYQTGPLTGPPLSVSFPSIYFLGTRMNSTRRFFQ